MRGRWSIRVFVDAREYPLAGVLDSFARLRVMRSRKWRRAAPVLRRADEWEFNCPSCGSWWPVRANEPQEPGGRPVAVEVEPARGRLSIRPGVICPVWLAQELGHPYPETRCEGGRYLVTGGVLIRVGSQRKRRALFG